MIDLKKPKYTPPITLKVTGLRPETLQTWVNRGVIQLEQQNPGRGKQRLYSAIDVVKLAIMRRADDLNIALSVAKDWAEGVAVKLNKHEEVEWGLLISHRQRQNLDGILTVKSTGGPLAKYSPTIGDTRDMRVLDFVGPDGGGMFSRRDKTNLGDSNYSDERPINPEKREFWARQGIHAEPVIIFPIGEIVNGTLAQLRAIEETENNND